MSATNATAGVTLSFDPGDAKGALTGVLIARNDGNRTWRAAGPDGCTKQVSWSIQDGRREAVEARPHARCTMMPVSYQLGPGETSEVLVKWDLRHGAGGQGEEPTAAPGIYWLVATLVGDDGDPERYPEARLVVRLEVPFLVR